MIRIASASPGYMGDGLGSGDPGDGCTPWVTVPSGTASYSFTIHTRAYVNGNWLDAGDVDGDTATWTIGSWSLATGSAWSLLFGTPPGASDRRFQALGAVAKGLYEFNGGMTGETLDIRALESGESICGTNVSCWTGDQLVISSQFRNTKFLITHELGHAVGDLRTSPGGLSGGNCGGFGTEPSTDADDCPPSANNHSLGSIEFQKCAMNEGFAHSYSASVWNSTSETNCAFQYYKDEFGAGNPYVDCEGASTNVPVGYIEAVCTAQPWPGKGVEVDWMRQFWDVKTNGSSDPNLSQMIDWIEDANTLNGSFSDTNVYFELDEAANNTGGSINTNWDSMKSTNDVDH